MEDCVMVWIGKDDMCIVPFEEQFKGMEQEGEKPNGYWSLIVPHVWLQTGEDDDDDDNMLHGKTRRTRMRWRNVRIGNRVRSWWFFISCFGGRN